MDSGVGLTHCSRTCRVSRCPSILRMWLSQFQRWSLARIRTSTAGCRASVETQVLTLAHRDVGQCCFSGAFSASCGPLAGPLPWQQTRGSRGVQLRAHHRTGKTELVKAFFSQVFGAIGRNGAKQLRLLRRIDATEDRRKILAQKC